MSRVPAVLVAHADLAAALLRAAEQVYGPVEGVGTLSNSGCSRETIEAEVGRHVAAWTAGGLVLTDFWGGSCTIGALAAARGVPGVIVVSGLNLAMLLDYLHNRDQVDAPALAERLRSRAQDSIRVHPGPPA
jgi:mannose/fructose-specific phosphotransferase system component IIA